MARYDAYPGVSPWRLPASTRSSRAQPLLLTELILEFTGVGAVTYERNMTS
jgi:hypothetical protein